MSPLLSNILGHIPNGNIQIVDPLDPYNRLYPFVASRRSDFQDAISPAGSRDLPSPGSSFNLCIGFVVLADQVDIPDIDQCVRFSIAYLPPLLTHSISRTCPLRATI